MTPTQLTPLALAALAVLTWRTRSLPAWLRLALTVLAFGIAIAWPKPAW